MGGVPMTPPNLSSGRSSSRPSCLDPGRHLIGLHLCCTTTCLLLYLLGIDAICSSTYRGFTASEPAASCILSTQTKGEPKGYRRSSDNRSKQFVDEVRGDL